MKIAIVCYPTFGGSGVVATELGVALAKKGHEIHFITYQQPVRLTLLNSNIHYHEVDVPKYPLFHYQPYELALSSKLVDTLKTNKIDILHVHYAIPHAYAGYMAKQILESEKIYLPMITTLHGTDITLVGKHPNYKTAVTFSINQSDMVTCVSQSLKKDTLSEFAVDKDIEVIPNFVKVAHYNQKYMDCDRSLMAKENEKIITHISNFRKIKRIPDVIHIFNYILQKLPAKLLMVGGGPEKTMAEDLCCQLGIRDKVLFLGKSNEVDKILCFSDLFLLPSTTESFGMSALEAMINKTPVISSNTGGLPEVNEHGVTGFLHEVGEVMQMSKSAISILEDEKKLNLFKENAYKKASSFDIRDILPLYENLYKRALHIKKNTI